MPWGDCTGPWWANQKSSGESTRVPMNPRCRGRGIHSGRGFLSRQAIAAPSGEPIPAEERSYLEEAAKRLEDELKAVRVRIEKLQSTQ